LQGTIYTGPYPFESEEADYDYARYRRASSLKEGKGVLQISGFLRGVTNANDWPAADMTIAYRLHLWRTEEGGGIDHLGFYDSVVSFREDKDKVRKNLTIVEGPFINMIISDDPGVVIVAFETDADSKGRVYISGPVLKHRAPSGEFKLAAEDAGGKRRHELKITWLVPSAVYYYYVEGEEEGGEKISSPKYSFMTAPRRGEGSVAFAFGSDSREGVGSGERNYMGSNFYVMSRLANHAYRKGAAFCIFGGDLVNGYTSEVEDFSLQLKGWKQALAGFWRSNPVYPAMGNHEALLNFYYDKESRRGVVLDKWPYATQSAEAIFAQEFWNPTNGPKLSDERRPPYSENVYHFQYGPVLCVAFNNNYWYSSSRLVKDYGGSPEGYIMEDQLSWIERVLEKAEKDDTVHYIVLYAQEPIFPCGGHVGDAMWWNGDNNLRAYERPEGKSEVVESGKGMIEVRNRFWGAVAKSSKVAAVMAGDEHEYYRLLVDKDTPVGLYPEDDTDGDGILDKASPNPDFKHPTWHITAGTAGAPYYARQETPWEPVILSSQHGYCFFQATESKISMTYYSVTGQAVDYVDDLMAVKEAR
jgi:3',5'-cyclic AMP phosphodiesterase CpdA